MPEDSIVNRSNRELSRFRIATIRAMLSVSCAQTILVSQVPRRSLLVCECLAKSSLVDINGGYADSFSVEALNRRRVIVSCEYRPVPKFQMQ